MSSRHSCIVLAVLFVVVPAARAQDKVYRPELSAKDIDATLRTDWYGVYLKDAKAAKSNKNGYVRSTRARDGDAVVEDQFIALKLVSFKQKVEMNMHHRFTFDAAAPYRMRAAEFTLTSGPIEQRTTYTRKGDRAYEAVHQVGREKRVVLLKNIDYTLADSMATEVWVKQDPKVGDRIVARTFDLQDQTMDEQSNEVTSAKSSLAGGVAVRVFEIKGNSKNKSIPSVSRYDDKGDMLSTEILTFELRKETEAQARNFDYSQDLFVMGMVKVDRPVGDTKHVAELVLEVGGKDTDVFESGPRQAVVTDGGKRVLKLGKAHGKPARATEKEIQDALQETNNYPITNPKVKALADKVTAGATTPREKVRKIVDFTYEFVKPSLAANAPNIHDLLENKKGDCKSYALLVTNLARAAGVPAREVSGLLYVGDDFKAFGGHAWNEVVLDGEWVPVDASLRETEVSATHISFGSEHVATKNLLSSLGKLSFKLVSVK